MEEEESGRAQQCARVSLQQCARVSLQTQAFMCVISVPYQGDEERVFEAEWSGDGQDGVEAAQQSSKQDEFANVRLHGQASQVETQRRQVLWTVQGVLAHKIVRKKEKKKKKSHIF